MPVKRFLEHDYVRLVAWGLLVLSLVLSVAVQFVVRNQSRCVARWADASTARSERLTTLNATVTDARTARDKQLSDLIIAAIKGHKATPAALNMYVDAAVAADKAEKAYKLALVSNPVPPAPKYTC